MGLLPNQVDATIHPLTAAQQAAQAATDKVGGLTNAINSIPKDTTVNIGVVAQAVNQAVAPVQNFLSGWAAGGVIAGADGMIMPHAMAAARYGRQPSHVPRRRGQPELEGIRGPHRPGPPAPGDGAHRRSDGRPRRSPVDPPPGHRRDDTHTHPTARRPDQPSRPGRRCIHFQHRWRLRRWGDLVIENTIVLDHHKVGKATSRIVQQDLNRRSRDGVRMWRTA